MIGLDTSVVLRLLIGEPAQQAVTARALLDSRARNGEPAACISDLVVGESYYALRHHYGVPHGEAVTALHLLLQDSRVQATGVAARVMNELREGSPGAGLMDRLIHGDYAQREAAALATFDYAASRLPEAQLLAG